MSTQNPKLFAFSRENLFILSASHNDLDWASIEKAKEDINTSAKQASSTIDSGPNSRIFIYTLKLPNKYILSKSCVKRSGG